MMIKIQQIVVILVVVIEILNTYTQLQSFNFITKGFCSDDHKTVMVIQKNESGKI